MSEGRKVKRKFGRYAALWPVVIIITVLFSMLLPSFYYSLQKVDYYDIKFDGAVVDTDWYDIVNNATANATAYSLYNLTILQMSVPLQLLPDQPFSVSCLIEDNYSAPVNYSISCSIDSGLNTTYLHITSFIPLGGAIIQSSGAAEMRVNCSSVRDTGHFSKTSIRYGDVLHSGINLFELRILCMDGKLYSECKVNFTIEIIPDSNVFIISNGLASSAIIVGVAITAVWIIRERRKNKVHGSSHPESDILNNTERQAKE